MEQVLEALKCPELREFFEKELQQENLEDEKLEAQRILENRQASIPTRRDNERNHVLTNAIRRSLAR